ncbi:MAG TPA: histidine kinase dimerization/phospho-acceptor domain-containing protein, partial [Ktedonobacterales bacterium]|nr:histidine kinase dimerization/phospho-acceptor domain-containing protein [Ktedonobacterales bacterium]
MERPPAPQHDPVSAILTRLRQLLSRSAARTAGQTPYHVTRRRLVVINLAVVSAILLLMSSAIFIVETHALQQQVEQQLHSRADSELAGAADLVARSQGQTPIVRLPDSAEHDGSEQYEPSGPNIFSVVINTKGNVIGDPSGVGNYGLPDLKAAAPVLSGAAHEQVVSAKVHDQEYLLLTEPLYSDSKLVGAIQVGQSLTPMEQQTHDLLVTLFLVGVGALTLTALASLYLADRALLPMRQAYDRERQFAAAASHELRTPLAFVRSQLELVSRRMQRAQAGASGTFTTPAAL